MDHEADSGHNDAHNPGRASGEKDTERYGDDPTALITVGPSEKPNQFQAHYLLGPPMSKNTPGYNSGTSSKRKNY